MGTSLRGDDKSKTKGDYSSDFFLPNTLKLVKPRVDSVTVIRIIPELVFNEQGQPIGAKPMIEGFGASVDGVPDPRFSNFLNEEVVINAGTTGKFSGFIKCADMPDLGFFDLPYGAIYGTARDGVKKGKLDPIMTNLVNRMTTKVQGKSTEMPKTEKYTYVQAIVLQENGVPCNPPIARAAVALSASARQSLLSVLMKAHELGIDMFDYDKGFSIRIRGGEKKANFTEFLAEAIVTQDASGAMVPMVVPAEYRGTFLPWKSAVKLYTFDEHLKKLASIFPKSVVALRPNIAERMTQLGIPLVDGAVAVPPGTNGGFGVQAAPAAAHTFVPPAQTYAPPATNVPQVSFGQPASAPVGFGAAPAQTGGFGAPAPAQVGFGAAPAPVQNGFGVPAAAPAQVGFGAPTPAQASVGFQQAAPTIQGPTAPAPMAADQAALMEKYKEMLSKDKPAA